MRKSVFSMACVMALLLLLSQLKAQPVSKFTALNQYVAFSNECIHMLSEIRTALETANRSAVIWATDSAALPPKYQMHRRLHDFSYYGWRQGVCTRIPEIKDPVENIERLYQLTKAESFHIPETYSTRINQQRDELMFIMIEVWALSDSLEKVLGEKKGLPRTDSRREEAQRLFHRLEILYHDFQAMRDKLAFTIQEAAGPGPPELQDLSLLLFSSQQLVQAVRHQPYREIGPQLDQLRQSIQSATQMQETRAADMKNIDLYHSRDLTGYRYMISHARELLRIGEEYARTEQEDPVIDRYGRNYFYYNQRLLPSYNHSENGMIAYYNSFVRFANTHLVQRIEEVPWFRALDLPESVPPPEKAFADTEPAPEAPHVVNHLVFLLDVSASMNKPEKLPLLKDALAGLMELMRPEDRISIVSYSGHARLILSPTSALRSDEIIQAIETLRSGGMTHFRQGIRIAYQVAESQFIEGGNNRILLATDGAFRIAASTLRKVQRKSGHDIPLSVFFLGKKMADQTSRRLEELARAGTGNFVHMTPEKADEALRREVSSLRE